ncbi:transposase, partial [Actinoplanes sp. Pm04-4]|nr:transposase [Actinoplanes pyxinae]
TTGTGPVIPQPLTTPPVAPSPVMPPPLAPRPVTPPPAVPAALFPNRAPAPGNRPVSVPPPPPGMTPITPGSRPPAGTRTPAAPTGTGTVFPAASVSSAPSSGAPGGTSPADTGQPFRATLTNAAINSARAERQRTVIPPRPSTRSTTQAADATDYSLPMPSQRPGGQEPAEPGSRANWPLINSGNDDAATTPAASTSAPPADGRVRPPWQDMPKEPPALRLVESQLGNGLDATVTDMPPIAEPPPLRLVEGRNGTRRSPGQTTTKLTALDRSTTPPVPSDGNDTDLLIFAAARSAWFTGHSEQTDKLDWTNPNDTGWRAAEKASTPAVAAETAAGLPKRVPQANLVPGSPLRDERPLRIVRDAASIAAHTTGYFRGWRRGQEIGGFAMGGRPGREAAGGWDFTRDREGADDFRNNNAGYGSR